MFRRTVQFLTFTYATLLLALLIALEWWAEKNWLISLLLFAPGWGFLLPLALLGPLALIRWQWRLLLLQSCCALVVLFGYTTFRWRERPLSSPGDIKLVTHNIGQGNTAQFTAFLQAEMPDIILLQDAAVGGAPYLRLFPSYFTSQVGEYVCISRYPIAKPSSVRDGSWQGRPVAVRFEITVDRRQVAFYSVHMATPRPQLRNFLSPAFVREVLKDRRWPKEVEDYQTWLRDQTGRAEALARKISLEKLPVIVAGDFNTPDHGYIYHLFAKRTADAFAKAGRGWGMTFPGGRDGETAGSRPWLRLDYIFAGSDWNVLFCEPETGTRSQHRAVMSILRPRLPSQN
jgi:endonuclease/exonuclease/phosphatase family metal-dependent hydrolase